MTWIVRDCDTDEPRFSFDSEAEARGWINERTMPWNFYAVEEGTMPTNIDDAIVIANRLGDLSLVRATLIGIFARRELDGGRPGALLHPLMERIEAEKLELEDRLIQLI